MIRGGRRIGFALSAVVHAGIAGTLLIAGRPADDAVVQLAPPSLTLDMFRLPIPPPRTVVVEQVPEAPPAIPVQQQVAERVVEPRRRLPKTVETPVPTRPPRPRQQRQVKTGALVVPRTGPNKPVAVDAPPAVVATPASVPVASSGTRSTQTASYRDDVSARRAYLAALAAAINRKKYYPRLAKRRREQGSVVVSFVVERDGRLSDVKIVSSSTIDRLDQAALKTLHRISPFKPIPASVKRERWQISVPIEYRLR